jgi:hypothetical protein
MTRDGDSTFQVYSFSFEVPPRGSLGTLLRTTFSSWAVLHDLIAAQLLSEAQLSASSSSFFVTIYKRHPPLGRGPSPPTPEPPPPVEYLEPSSMSPGPSPWIDPRVWLRPPSSRSEAMSHLQDLESSSECLPGSKLPGPPPRPSPPGALESQQRLCRQCQRIGFVTPQNYGK